MKYIIRDPFVGEIEIEGETLEDAIIAEYENIPNYERPAYVWYEGERVGVLGGECKPVQ